MKLPWSKPPAKKEISIYDIKDLSEYLDTRLKHYVSQYDLKKSETDKMLEGYKKEHRRQIIIMIISVALFIWLEILTMAVFSPHH